MPRDSGSGHHGGRHQVGSRTRSLTALEITVGGGSAAFAGWHQIAVHAYTHGTARLTPLQARLTKNAIESLGFGLSLHLAGAGGDDTGYLAASTAQYLGSSAQIFQTGVGAGADKNLIDSNVCQLLTG